MTGINLTELVIIGIGLTQAIVIPWAIWVTTQMFQLQRDLALKNQNDSKIDAIIIKIEAQMEIINSQLQEIKIALASNNIQTK